MLCTFFALLKVRFPPLFALLDAALVSPRATLLSPVLLLSLLFRWLRDGDVATAVVALPLTPSLLTFVGGSKSTIGSNPFMLLSLLLFLVDVGIVLGCCCYCLLLLCCYWFQS
ncbi:hypothetical protein BVRB_5g110940 [Beta vulgaris subsp. vulgaris]|nr:hypothetical protein BVRB_5g110940 [Beta vulgaris subsp. vulgaris]